MSDTASLEQARHNIIRVKIYRFPRYAKVEPQTSCLSVSTNESNASLIKLEDRAIELIKIHSKSRLEIGLLLLQLKAKKDHGDWKPYFLKTFGGLRINLRTAQRYMKLAKRHEIPANSENDTLSLFKPATDRQAVKVRKATAKANAEVFRLLLRVSANEHKAMSELLRSPNWPKAQRKIVRFLNRLCIKFGVIDGRA
jgi:hypothetical protein